MAGRIAESATYGRPDGDAELEAICAIESQAFGVTVEEARTWLQACGADNLRVLRRGRRTASSLVLLPMGQFFGGRSVPMVGVAGVATDPALRGSGSATALMRAAVAELSAAGWPIATLYPATQPLYRRAGFEQAGSRFRISAAPRALDLRDHDLPVRAFTPADREALERAYADLARSRPGYLDRGRYVWDRVLHPRGEQARGFLVEEDGRIDAWVFLLQRRTDGGRYRLEATELAARTPRAASRLVTFLADHASMSPEVSWHGSADEPLLLLPQEIEARVELYATWMLRILDPVAALEARGYPPGLSAELHLEVHDEIAPRCAGRFVARVSGGAATVAPGGDGRVRLHARGLAALYTGHRSAEALAVAGLVEGEADDLRIASAAFAGPAPAMADMF